MYAVVFRTIGGACDGAITWTSFTDEAQFQEWYDDEAESKFEVVESGVTKERAIELCTSPAAQEAAVLSMLRQANDLLG